MARSLIGSAWLYQQDAALPSIPAPSRDITAGSVVVYRWRYETGAPAASSFSDGTAATWTTLEFGTNPTVGYAVCLNHPGGTGTVGTVNLSSSRAFGYIYGVELTGGTATIDDAPAGTTGTNPSLAYTATSDGTGFAVTGYYSGSGITPTSPAALETSAHAYSGYWKLDHTGAGSKSMTTTGGSGNTVSLVVVIKDASGGGGSVTADQGSYSLTGQTAGLTVTRLLTADHGTYSLTGQDVTLTKETPGQFVMTADSGTYSWAGVDALADYAMNIGHGTYGLAGQDVIFSRTFPQAFSITADAGSYSWAGKAARLVWSNEVITVQGKYTISMSMKIGI